MCKHMNANIRMWWHKSGSMHALLYVVIRKQSAYGASVHRIHARLLRPHDVM